MTCITTKTEAYSTCISSNTVPSSVNSYIILHHRYSIPLPSQSLHATVPATTPPPLRKERAQKSIPFSLMGEQTQSQHQSQPLHDSNSQPLPATTATESPSSDLSKNPSNPSKIPIRPQKIRKLSSPASEDKPPALLSGDDNSSKAVTVFKDTNTSSITTTTTKNRRRNPSQSARDFPKIIKPLSAEGEIDLALHHLRAADPLLANLIDTHPPPAFESHHLPFLALAKSILYQQLAYKAGTSIYTRFVALCGGEEAVLPDVVLSLSTQQLKQVGVSGRKASYLYDLANKYQNGILSDESVVRMDDRSLFTMLSMVKGIGSWSVQMFMIFSLHRPDVLPVNDLGVRKGVQLLYGLEELPRPSQMEQLCDKWRPYRSVGAWYMWRLVEGKGTPAARAAVALEGGVPTQQQIEQQHEAHQQQIEQQHEAHQQQHQLQLLEPINGIGNLGPCIWGQ